MKRKALVAVACAALVFAGCSHPQDSVPQEARITGGDVQPDGTAMQVSLVKEYRTTEDVLSDASLVLTGHVRGSSIEHTNGVPFTYSDVEVHKVLTGELGPDRVRVVQTGEVGGNYIPELPPFLMAGKTYLLALQPISEGVYEIVGPAAWVSANDGYVLYAYQGTEVSPDIPRQADLETFRPSRG